jgi:uncharacterized protein YhfF
MERAWGRGKRTPECWLGAHRRYFARQSARDGFELSEDILTVFERFEVVWPLDWAVMITGPRNRREGIHP